MQFNNGTFNSSPLNGGASAVAVYTISADIEQSVFVEHTITATIEQSVFVLHTVAVDFEQTVVVREVYAVSAAIGQTVIATHTIDATISQAITAPSASDAIKWQAVVTLDGSTVQDLVGVITMEAGEGESRIASFQARPASGVLDLLTWLGSPVTIDYLDDKGNYRRRFTGTVDEPVYDITRNVATFNCVSSRRDLLNAKTRTQIDLGIGGYYSTYISDPDLAIAEYAEERLKTVDATYDMDEFNTFRKVPFAAKATPDYTYTESDILNESLSFQLTSRDQLVNQITINFDYRYPRLRHRERTYFWDFLAPRRGHGSWGGFLQRPTSLCPRAAIETAINGTSWLLKGTPTYTGLPDAGYYRLPNGSTSGWSPRTQSLKFQRDADGNLILDSNDQPIQDTRTETNVQNVYAIDAEWTMAKRFAQTITEAYQVTIKATQSVAQYGVVEREESRGIRANYDTSQWEEYTVYSAPIGSLSPNGDYITDVTGVEDGSRADFNNAWNTVEAMTRREIKETHRANYVDFALLLDPRLDLRHTVYVNTGVIQARGKIARIIERMDIDEGSAIQEIRLAISKSTGAAPSDSGIAPPAAATTTDQTVNAGTKLLYNHFGNSYDSPALDGTESGFICNYRFVDKFSTQIQFYPTKFVVDGEQVSEAERDERIVESVQTKEIAIPDELLTVTV